MATSPVVHDTTASPRCAAPKRPDLWLCPACYIREPFVRAGCAARDAAILDFDPDLAIPSELTPRVYAALGAADARTVDATPTRPQTASQTQHAVSGEAACPRCGHVRGVVADGSSTRCYGCWHCWIPEPSVA